MVRERGLEPPRLAALVPQTSVSTISPLAPMYIWQFTVKEPSNLTMFRAKTQEVNMD